MPSTPTAMRRSCRLLSRVAEAEAALALARVPSISHDEERTHLEMRYEASRDQLTGQFSYVETTGTRYELALIVVRLAVDGSSIWVAEGEPPMRGWLLDRVDVALDRWLASMLGEALHGRVLACARYADALSALASQVDPNIPTHTQAPVGRDREAEARQAGADLAVLLFTDADTARRNVARAVADGWRGGLADLLDVVDGVLADPKV